MNKNTIGFTAALIAACVAIVIGCTIQDPASPIDPLTGKPVPHQVPDPRINSASNTVTGVAGVVAPANPWAGLTDYALKAGFGLLGVVTGYIAQRRNTVAAQADATQKQVLLSTVIQGVEAAGPAADAVKNAIQARATSSGVQPELDAVVQSVVK